MEGDFENKFETPIIQPGGNFMCIVRCMSLQVEHFGVGIEMLRSFAWDEMVSPMK